ncbi:hypothetical protein [Erythrobacter ani]|uniref:Tetratricopeptide repeat protein n=1 Tax=Erythrobacter ani TaxID=2827235 RepID=A0ABS6SR05_9SPHN|nr:hypothetical protein [Erythrobacter ani]MBV7267478.1 hypothetical protein [Erythrobacter ani]
MPYSTSVSFCAMLRAFLSTLVLVIGGPAFAETLSVEGFYGAQADIPAEIEVLVAEPFAGDWGYGLQESVTGFLIQPIIADAPFFRVIPAALAARDRIYVIDSAATSGDGVPFIEVTDRRRETPDAVLQGAAFSRINDVHAAPRTVEECIRRDGENKCIEHEEVEIPCREMTVAYDAHVAIIQADGTRVYDDSAVLTSAQTYCRDGDSSPDPDAMIGALAARYAESVRRDLLPEFKRSDPRLLERRKGLSKQDRRVFKQALRLTKNDPFGACLLFRQLEDGNPRHVSVLFNIGLCEEAEDRLDQAAAYYERALIADPGRNYPQTGLRRIENRKRGEWQLAAKGLI